MAAKSIPSSLPLPGLPSHGAYKDRPPGRHSRTLKLLGLLSLLSLSLTLSNEFPVPWSFSRLHSASQRLSNGPSSEWHDDTWPIRDQTPWDISTDFIYPRKLEYDVTEGTWLRLDVHPKTGDIVFDMVGDLYCIPSSEIDKVAVARAKPILRGVPHDSDPHFSPEGDRLVFRSDAELGVENIWVMEWKGCHGMDLEGYSKNKGIQEADEALLLRGVKETIERKTRRLLGEGRLGAQRITNETYRWVSDARFHPSGSKLIATKWYTSVRSLGAGEGWEYSVPSLEDLQQGRQSHVKVAAGHRFLGRTLPPGWTDKDYGDQQIGPEQLIWKGGDALIYAKNVADQSSFTYSKGTRCTPTINARPYAPMDVHLGIYAIFQTNLTSQTTQTIVSAFPGGASRPELSRDGRTLAFVRRVRDKQALVFKDLTTGSIHHVWYGLTYDLSGVSAPMGTYPSFAFTPSDDAVIIWAAGQIYKVPLSSNKQGEKLAADTSPYPIRFTARIKKRLAETLRGGATDLVKLETQDEERVRSFRGLQVDDKGERVVFEAAGVTYLHSVYDKDGTTAVPVSDTSSPYYSPTFIHGYEDLVLHSRWSDSNLTAFELANVSSKHYFKLSGLPLGRYFSPVVCESEGSHRHIAFVKSGGDYLTGNLVATANPGLYIGHITLPADSSASTLPIRDIKFVESEVDPNDHLKLRFLDGSTKLLVQQSSRSFIIDLGAGPNNFGKYPHRTLVEGKMSSELAVSVKAEVEGLYVADQVGFVDLSQVYLAPGNATRQPVWSKPGNASAHLARVSLDGGHDIAWSRDGKKLFWFLGPYLHSIETFNVPRCSAAINNDPRNFGIDCIKDLLYYQEVVVKQPTHVAQAHRSSGKAVADDSFMVFNATLLTMATGSLESDLIKESVLSIRRGVIQSIDSVGNFLANGSIRGTVIDAGGGYVIPGFVDVHAHWEGYANRYPSKSWEMETFLAYGVTTLHNPSAQTVGSFIERSRVEAGFTIGPRIFSVGNVIYGAAEAGLYQDVTNLAEARSALIRIKAEGGPYAISYKNYNIPSRASRQRLLLAARNLSMLCVPEGGMNYDWDLTYITDGMTTVEHALPVPTLYEDILTLFALSGTGSTPTHLVNFGGAFGEQFVWANEDVPNDPKLRRFMRHDILEGLTESTARPKTSYALFNTSYSVAKMVHKGLLANIGAHGEHPLGLNYHAEMEFTRAGGLTRYETLRAATIHGAKTLGLDRSIGSLEPGKLADFLVYAPGVDLLKDDENASGGKFTTAGPTRDIFLVARAGRVWKAETMEEVWPVKRPRQAMPSFNPD